MLFAAGVVFFEGSTDQAALAVWLDTSATGEPTPDEKNVLFLSVDGQNSFGQFVGLARRLEVPWAVVADGPALRPGSTMAGQLHALGVAVPSAATALEDVRAAWAAQGVFSLADAFGDDGSKEGEIEAFLERVDSAALTAARKAVGAKKGSRVGAAFAAAVAPPKEVVELWRAVQERLR
ncbi:TOPRIM nucleotidyl transferase/hydrolase domain-containing protein [Actinoplanes sp. NPDC024001]|uniref:TOPRIM nucleotidyl transferase/hydrolase domain-containing protein n=1 Tax=Actinoplanes sp. NPDC024001 TaxID=3154598 RepID=UPI0033E35A27